MSGDENLILAYNDGKDIYAWIASKIYRVPYDECKEFRPDGTKNPGGKKRRDSVKSILLGIMYGRGARAIAEQLNCSVKDAQKIIDTFYNEFPRVRKWMDSVLEFAKRTGYVETAWGRKRRLLDMRLPPYEFSYIGDTPSNFDPLDFENDGEVAVDERTRKYYLGRLSKAWGRDKLAIIQSAASRGIKIKDNTGFIAEASRQCVNSIIQGSSADMTKLAMIAIGNDPFLRERDCHLVIQVHDEVIAECPEQYAAECAQRISELMINSAKEKISVPMKCDAEITRVWYGEVIAT